MRAERIAIWWKLQQDVTEIMIELIHRRCELWQTKSRHLNLLSLSPRLCVQMAMQIFMDTVSILLLIHLLWSVITVKYPFLTPMFNFPRVEILYCFNKLQTNQQDQWKHSLPLQNESDYLWTKDLIILNLSLSSLTQFFIKLYIQYKDMRLSYRIKRKRKFIIFFKQNNKRMFIYPFTLPFKLTIMHEQMIVNDSIHTSMTMRKLTTAMP